MNVLIQVFLMGTFYNIQYSWNQHNLNLQLCFQLMRLLHTFSESYLETKFWSCTHINNGNCCDRKLNWQAGYDARWCWGRHMLIFLKTMTWIFIAVKISNPATKRIRHVTFMLEHIDANTKYLSNSIRNVVTAHTSWVVCRLNPHPISRQP
jgi:hypothetical protein